MHFQTCGVACFFASRSGTAASSGGKLQMSRQTQYIVEILFSSIIFRGRRSARDTVFLQVALSTSAGRGWSFVARTSLVAVRCANRLWQ